MPQYSWQCAACGREVDVIRSVANRDVPPNSEDIPKEPFETCEHPNWVRRVALTQPHQHAPGFGSKGNWLLPLALFLGGLFAAPRAYAWRLLDADDVSMEGYQIVNNRDTYWPYADPAGAQPGQEYWTKGAAANLKLTLLGLGEDDWFRLYMDNRVHGESTNDRFREVGWQYETGIALDSKVDLYWFHHSQHLLDAEPDGRFPLQNFVGVRVHFYRRGESE